MAHSVSHAAPAGIRRMQQSGLTESVIYERIAVFEIRYAQGGREIDSLRQRR